MNPVSRKESLDALHQAQKLQAVLRHFLVWARRLRAEMDAQSPPISPAEARRMIAGHWELKVRVRILGPCLLPALSRILIPTFPWVLSPSPASAFLLFHPTQSAVFPPLPSPLGLLPPTHGASASRI